MVMKGAKKKALGRPKGSKNQKAASWPAEVQAHLNVVAALANLNERLARVELLLSLKVDGRLKD